MEVVPYCSSPDQIISPHNKHHIRNPMKNTTRPPFISRRSENFAPSNSHDWLAYPPPPSLSNSFGQRQQQQQQQRRQQHQPPLLQLPINRKINDRSNGQKFRTAKKSIVTKISSESLIIASTELLGPEAKDLPNDISRVLSKSYNNTSTEDQVDKFSGSVVFSLSPPPSSLPLPTFSLRPKLSCNAEATGIDAGATDSLRRLLRLR